ncbi:uncharacterized protein LOC131663388 [Phymastichus coffea]|uniref:uncharacterized protein LOC131663388 n=1 Tax=Phymastichus coffea TaxID=108790 RepID=UPI00273AAF1B|nr:uncharacterized protein LOC131663388 [Phymastichus coffea]
MFALILWTGYNTTSTIDINQLVPDKEEGEETMARYSDGKLYQVKIIRKNVDKHYLRSLAVSTDGELILRKGNSQKKIALCKQKYLKQKLILEKNKLEGKKQATNVSLLDSKSVFQDSDSEKEEIPSHAELDGERNGESSKRKQAKLDGEGDGNFDRILDDSDSNEDDDYGNGNSKVRNNDSTVDKRIPLLHSRHDRDRNVQIQRETLYQSNDDGRIEDAQSRLLKHAGNQKQTFASDMSDDERDKEKEKDPLVDSRHSKRDQNDDSESDDSIVERSRLNLARGRNARKSRRISTSDESEDDGDKEDDPLANSRLYKPGKVLISEDFPEVWINKTDLTCLLRWRNKPKEMGKDFQKKAITEDITACIEYYVNKKCPEGLTPAQFTTVANYLIGSIRHPKK